MPAIKIRIALEDFLIEKLHCWRKSLDERGDEARTVLVIEGEGLLLDFSETHAERIGEDGMIGKSGDEGSREASIQ